MKMYFIKNLINKIARRIVEQEIREEIGYRIRSDAQWFIPGTPEYIAVNAIGEQLIKCGYWDIQRIREDNKLSSPARLPNRHVKIYPDGSVSSSLNSSNETHRAIAKAFERTMPDRIWENF